MFQHKKRLLLGALSLAVLLWEFAIRGGADLMIPLAYAQIVSSVIDTSTVQKLSEGAAQILSFLNVVSWMFFIVLNYLLDPSFIFQLNSAGTPSLETKLNEIWQFSRDIVNVVLAVALILAAIYTIVTADRTLIQQHAVTFILAVILVNFSWFFPRVIFDIANVTAAAVFSLPRQILAGEDCKVPDGMGGFKDCTGIVDAAIFPKKCEILDPTTCTPPITNSVGPFTPDKECVLYDQQAGNNEVGAILCYKKAVIKADTIAGEGFILNGLIISIGGLDELINVPKSMASASTISALIIFAMRVLVVLLIQFAIFSILAALTIAFILRIPVLWVTIAFMPFVALGYVLGDKVGDVPKKIMTQFIHAAFLPALVGIPLSIGIVLLMTLTKVSFVGLDAVPIRIFDNLQGLTQFLWLALALGIMWKGVFMVLEKEEIMGAGAGAIKQWSQGAAKAIAKLPLAATVIPGTKMTAYQAMSLAKSPEGIVGGIAAERARAAAAGEDFSWKRAMGQHESSQAADKALNTGAANGGNQELQRKLDGLSRVQNQGADKITQELEQIRATLLSKGMATTQQIGAKDSKDYDGLLNMLEEMKRGNNKNKPAELQNINIADIRSKLKPPPTGGGAGGGAGGAGGGAGGAGGGAGGAGGGTP